MKVRKQYLMSVLALGLSFLIVGCSSGGGGDNSSNSGSGGSPSAVVITSTTSVAGTIGASSSGVVSKAVSTTSEGTATLIIDTGNNGVFTDADDFSYSAPIINGAFSFDDVAVRDENATKALLKVEREGYSEYTKILDLLKDDPVAVYAEVSTKPILTEEFDIASLSSASKASSFLRFGTREGSNGVESFSKFMTLSEFNAEADDLNLSDSGTLSESTIPVAALPDGLKTLKVQMQSFDSSNEDDFAAFPGELTGFGQPAGIGASATTDSNGRVALESAGFDMLKLTDGNGEQVDLDGSKVKFSKLFSSATRTVCGGMSWTRYLHSNEVAVIKKWGDDDNATAGYQVPIWSNDNATGSWSYIGLATIPDINASRPYFTMCVDKKWQGYLNCDSPLATSRPKQICVSAQDQFGNLAGNINIRGKKGGQYSSTTVRGYGRSKGKATIEVKDANISGWAYSYRSALTGWSYIEIDPSLIVSPSTNTDCDYDMNLTVNNPYTSVVHVQVFAIDDVNQSTPLVSKRVTLRNNTYEEGYSKYAYTDANGTATFEVKPNVDYEATYAAGATTVNANGTVAGDETADTTRDVYVNVQDKNIAPQVYVDAYAYNVSNNTESMQFYVSARDGNYDALTFNGLLLDTTPLVENVDYTVTYKRSYNGYFYIKGTLNLQSATLKGIGASLASSSTNYKLIAKVTDTTLESQSYDSFRVSENLAPSINSLYLIQGSQYYYTSSRNIPAGDFNASVRIYDRDRDTFTAYISVDGGAEQNISSILKAPITLTNGDHNITVRAVDIHGNQSTKEFQNIHAGNHAPTISRVYSSSYFVRASDTFTLSANVYDSDGDTLSVKATDTNSVEYNLTKVYGNTYRSAPISIPATDNNLTFSIVANDTQTNSAASTIVVRKNRPPVFSTTLTDVSIFTGNSQTFTCTATDPDATRVYYRWLIDGVVQRTTYTNTYTQSFRNEGNYTIACSAYDRDGESASQDANVTVSVNLPPVFDTSLSDITVLEGATQTFTCLAHDPEQRGTVSYTMSANGGTELQVPSTGSGMSKTYRFDSLGIYRVSCTASDVDGKQAVSQATVTVVANQPPVFRTLLTDTSLDVNQTKTFTCAADDPEQTTVTYSWLLDNVSLGETNATLIKSFPTAGTYTLSCRAQDGDGKVAGSNATVTVNAVNQAPTVDFEVFANVDGNKTISGTINFSDSDGTATIAVTQGGITGFSIDTNTGAYTYNASAYAKLALGTQEYVQVYLEVTDNLGAKAYTYVSITVNGTYNPPVDTNTTLTFVDGMAFYGFYKDENIRADKNFLHSGTLEEIPYELNMTTGDMDRAVNSYDGYMLNGTVWSAQTTANYTLSTDNKILTLSDGTKVKVTGIGDLNGSTHKFSEAANATEGTPIGDVNVTFSEGAKVYSLSVKTAERYYVGYTPKLQVYDENTTQWVETNTTFSTIPAYMQSVNGFTEFLSFERDLTSGTQSLYHSYPIIDSTGSPVTSLVNGQTGNLVSVDASKPPFAQTVVGTWTVRALPDGNLGVIATPNSGLESHFNGDTNFLLAVVNGNVMMGAYIATAKDYVAEEDLTFNLQAYNDIKAALKTYVTTVGNTTPTVDRRLVDFFIGKTVYAISTHEVDGDRNASNDGQSYGSSMTFDTGTITSLSGYSGGIDENGGYGIQATPPNQTHSYAIVGNEFQVTEIQNGDNPGEKSVISLLQVIDENSSQFQITTYDLSGVSVSTNTGILYKNAQSRDAAMQAVQPALPVNISYSGVLPAEAGTLVGQTVQITVNNGVITGNVGQIYTITGSVDASGNVSATVNSASTPVATIVGQVNATGTASLTVTPAGETPFNVELNAALLSVNYEGVLPSEAGTLAGQLLHIEVLNGAIVGTIGSNIQVVGTVTADQVSATAYDLTIGTLATFTGQVNANGSVLLTVSPTNGTPFSYVLNVATSI